MKKLTFDIVGFIVGSLFFFIYLMVFEDSFFEFPTILSTTYFFICTICFAFILEDFESVLSKRLPAIFIRLIYLGLFFLAPLYFIALLTKDRKKTSK